MNPYALRTCVVGSSGHVLTDLKLNIVEFSAFVIQFPGTLQTTNSWYITLIVRVKLLEHSHTSLKKKKNTCKFSVMLFPLEFSIILKDISQAQTVNNSNDKMLIM